MNLEGLKMLEAVKRCGSVSLAAKELGVDACRMRTKLQRDLQGIGESSDHLKPRVQNRVIEKYLDRKFTDVRVRIRAPYNVNGVAICHVHNRLVTRNPNDIEGKLVGVYDRDGDADDMRDDLYWYVKNEMETES